ncbi:hypothetical protein ACFWPQ_25735 [Streptomyces sp. NPDC058464]|uniref:hypothetical protein n=1 Tax=Streptomyces sp. NPDC058464 TaxID=3346511 RepID=UPI003669589A
MPQDVTFDLPFETPVVEHPEHTSRDLSQAAARAWPRTPDPVVAPRPTGRACFLMGTAEAATQVLVL